MVRCVSRRPAGSRRLAVALFGGLVAGFGGREHRRERLAGVRGLHAGHLLGRALGDDLAAAAAPLRPEVDHPVGPLHDVEIVLHDEHRVARVDQPLEHGEQLPDVGHVKAGRRLVQYVERLAGRPLRQFAGEFHPLGLAAGERRRRLAEMEIVEADVAERLELPRDVGGICEDLPGVTDLHVQKLGDVLPLPADLERVFREPGTAADLARHPHVRQKIHVEPRGAVALAGFAAAAGHVETEPSRLPAPFLRLRQHREQIADVVPDLYISRRIASGRPADRRLVDHDHLVELIGPRDAVELAGHGRLAPEETSQLRLQHVAHERTFSTPGNPRHADEHAERDLDVDRFQVVVPHALERERFSTRLATLLRHLDRVAAGEEGARDRAVARGHIVGRAGGHDLTASLAGPGTEVDHPVGRPDRLLIVFDDDDSIALVAQGLEGAEQFHVVAGVQADRRLVEHVEHTREP